MFDVTDLLEGMDEIAVAEPVVEPVIEKTRKPRRSPQPETIYFDIETVPDWSRMSLFGLDPIPDEIPESAPEDLLTAEEFTANTAEEIKAQLAGKNPPDAWIDEMLSAENAKTKPRKNAKDLLESLRDAKTGRADAVVRQNKTMSLTPEFLRIAAIGWASGDEEPQSMLAVDAAAERELIETFWQLFSSPRSQLVGFNVLKFDLPAMFVRSAILGVKPSRQFDTRPWGTDVIDLMDKRFGRNQAIKLKDLARLYDIDVPAGDCDGSQVMHLLATNPEALAKYVESDIHVTRSLHRKWRGYFF